MHLIPVQAFTRFLAAGLLALLALPACGVLSPVEESRIHSDPDLGVSKAAGLPTDGILAGGGMYRIEKPNFATGECEQREAEDPLAVLKNPLTPNEESGVTRVAIPRSQLTALAEFVTTLELRSVGNGTDAVIRTGPDPSLSLPWTGHVTGGRDDRLLASALGDRSVEFDVKVPHDLAQRSDNFATATVSVTWRESATLPIWIGDPGENSATCHAEANATLLRTGGPPPAPTPPQGVAEVRGTDPSPKSTTLAGVLDSINLSSWQVQPDGVISLVQPDGRAAAIGTYLVSGGVYAISLAGTLPDVEVSFRGQKAEGDPVRGTLLVGGSEIFVELAG